MRGQDKKLKPQKLDNCYRQKKKKINEQEGLRRPTQADCTGTQSERSKKQASKRKWPGGRSQPNPQLKGACGGKHCSKLHPSVTEAPLLISASETQKALNTVSFTANVGAMGPLIINIQRPTQPTWHWPI